jgi:uncharacterized protein (TIGR02145 family)
MKTNYKFSTILTILFLYMVPVLGQVGISDTGAIVPHQKAILDLSSDSKGLLLPRLTSIQMSSLIPAPDGLLIYNIDSSQFYYYNGSIDGWQSLTPGSDTIKHICGAVFQDVRDYLIYSTIQIGSQCWMEENLRASKYRDGSAIPQVTSGSAWSTLTTGAFCWYNNDSVSNENTFGKLYNWHAVIDARGLCPIGWHIPSDAEFTILSTYLGGESVAGGKLKEVGLTHWASPNTGATNESGFTGLPGGYRWYTGGFYSPTWFSQFWTLTVYNSTQSYYRCLHFDEALLHRDPGNKKNGLFVRCIKDQ